MNQHIVQTKEQTIQVKEAHQNVIRLNISQFELTKLLYSSGMLSKIDLTPSAKLFLWALCSHYNPNNDSMFPSQQTVAQKLGISEKSAQRAVKELKTHGLIDYETKRVNHYTFGAKFFELVKMSCEGGQNVGREGGQNVRLTKNHEKRKEHTDFSSFKGRGWKRKDEAAYSETRGGKMVPGTEETRKLIEEHEKIREMHFNPYEFNREDALQWLSTSPKFWLVRSKLAYFLVQKYEFSEFQYVLSEFEGARPDFSDNLS